MLAYCWVRVSNVGLLLGQSIQCWPIAWSGCLMLAHCWARVSDVGPLLSQRVYCWPIAG